MVKNNSTNALYVADRRVNLQELSPHSILFVGGSRSGKSDFALNYAENFQGKKAFIATMQKYYHTQNEQSETPTAIFDNEVENRISRHQAQRGNTWLTIEEPLKLEEAIERAIKQNVYVILIDCISLWLSNLLLLEKKEEEIINMVESLAQNIKNSPVPLLFVSNEVGMGIVPLYQSARLFRDIQGKANQILAKHCQAVLTFSCGIPLLIKG